MTDPDISPDRPAVKAEPVITGIGRYRTRNGEIINIVSRDEHNRHYPWHSDSHDFRSGWPSTWNDAGAFRTDDGESPEDIIARVEEPDAAAEHEFRISGPGRYRNRRGDLIKITHRDDSRAFFKWRAGDGFGYTDGGSYWAEKQLNSLSDIVAGPFPDEPAPQTDAKEWAGLSGYATYYPASQTIGKCSDRETAERIASNGGRVIDLSTITADQLVQPKPEPVKRTARVWVFDTDTIITRWKDKNSFPGGGAGNLIAHFEIEIEYTPGDGLGDVS